MDKIYAIEAGWWEDDGLILWFSLHRTIEGAKAEAEKDRLLYTSEENNPLEWWEEDHSGKQYIHGVFVCDDKQRGYNIYEVTVKE